MARAGRRHSSHRSWRARRDSNSRPLGPQPNALSTELRAHAVRHGSARTRRSVPRPCGRPPHPARGVSRGSLAGSVGRGVLSPVEEHLSLRAVLGRSTIVLLRVEGVVADPMCSISTSNGAPIDSISSPGTARRRIEEVDLVCLGLAGPHERLGAPSHRRSNVAMPNRCHDSGSARPATGPDVAAGRRPLFRDLEGQGDRRGQRRRVPATRSGRPHAASHPMRCEGQGFNLRTAAAMPADSDEWTPSLRGMGPGRARYGSGGEAPPGASG